MRQSRFFLRLCHSRLRPHCVSSSWPAESLPPQKLRFPSSFGAETIKDTLDSSEKDQEHKPTDRLIDWLPPASSTGRSFHLSTPSELWESDSQAAEDSGKKIDKLQMKCVRAYVCAYVRACVRACVRVCVCVCAFAYRCKHSVISSLYRIVFLWQRRLKFNKRNNRVRFSVQSKLSLRHVSTSSRN